MPVPVVQHRFFALTAGHILFSGRRVGRSRGMIATFAVASSRADSRLLIPCLIARSWFLLAMTRLHEPVQTGGAGRASAASGGGREMRHSESCRDYAAALSAQPSRRASSIARDFITDSDERAPHPRHGGRSPFCGIRDARRRRATARGVLRRIVQTARQRVRFQNSCCHCGPRSQLGPVLSQTRLRWLSSMSTDPARQSGGIVTRHSTRSLPEFRSCPPAE